MSLTTATIPARNGTEKTIEIPASFAGDPIYRKRWIDEEAEIERDIARMLQARDITDADRRGLSDEDAIAIVEAAGWTFDAEELYYDWRQPGWPPDLTTATRASATLN